MSGISHTCEKFGNMELAVDVDFGADDDEEPLFTISIGTGFGSGHLGSVNIETASMGRDHFLRVLEEMRKAVDLPRPTN